MRELDSLCQRFALAQERELYQTAMICATICNVNRGKGKRLVKPEDFMPRKRQSAESMAATLKKFVAVAGGRVQEESYQVVDLSRYAEELANARTSTEKAIIRERIKKEAAKIG